MNRYSASVLAQSDSVLLDLSMFQIHRVVGAEYLNALVVNFDRSDGQYHKSCTSDLKWHWWRAEKQQMSERSNKCEVNFE